MGQDESPSSRRAWIEIESEPNKVQKLNVALLAEGVDRNLQKRFAEEAGVWSPSSRRAWIEIYTAAGVGYCLSVALLAEGVDRNDMRGEIARLCVMSPSSRRAWIEIVRESGGVTFPASSPSSRRAWIEILRPSRISWTALVALLAEGVDRNCSHRPRCPGGSVALLAEGVDRNLVIDRSKCKTAGRPPRGGRG